jgi:competence protein ComEA
VPGLTEAERKGALWLAALLLIGTAHDLHRAHRPDWAPAPAGAPALDTAIATAPADSVRHAPATTDGPLDLNRASAAELDRLPGIGPVLAGRIVEHRARHGPFRSPEELLAVPGIGPRLLERLRPHLR